MEKEPAMQKSEWCGVETKGVLPRQRKKKAQLPQTGKDLGVFSGKKEASVYGVE